MQGASQSQLLTAGLYFHPHPIISMLQCVRTQSNKPGQYTDHYTPRPPVH